MSEQHFGSLKHLSAGSRNTPVVDNEVDNEFEHELPRTLNPNYSQRSTNELESVRHLIIDHGLSAIFLGYRGG
jgi:hypothetical protein